MSSQPSPPERISRIVDNAKALASQDAAYAKEQFQQAGRHGGAAAGAGGAAAVLALYVVGFLGLAAGTALADHTDLYAWAAWLIVAGVFLVLLLIAGLVARGQANNAAAASQRATTRIQEDVAWAKEQIKP